MGITSVQGCLLQGMQHQTRAMSRQHEPLGGVSADCEVNSSALLLQGGEV